MQISITSTLTEKQAFILAKEKGYSDTVTVITNDLVVPKAFETIHNTQSPFDFLKAVYEEMIKTDAKRLFIAYDDRLNIDKKIAREQLLKDMVDDAFL